MHIQLSLDLVPDCRFFSLMSSFFSADYLTYNHYLTFIIEIQDVKRGTDRKLFTKMKTASEMLAVS
jgi:hypothetical protein